LSTIGERLKDERVRLGKSQTDMASVGGVGKTTQINYEKGVRSPDAAYLAAVAAAGVDVLYVLTGQRSSGEETLAPDEAALLDNYRNTAPERRHTISEVSQVYAASSSAEKKGKTGAN
jgi:transcriptional regulator with XRE-family HTH domain